MNAELKAFHDELQAAYVERDRLYNERLDNMWKGAVGIEEQLRMVRNDLSLFFLGYLSLDLFAGRIDTCAKGIEAMSDLKEEAKAAWDGFHAAVRRLDEVCKRDGVTLKIKIPTLGATKKKWVDGGYLGNGHCSFMYGSYRGACCRLPHGHQGQHLTDSQSAAV